MQPSDAQLLQMYVAQGSESAFRTLVERYTKLVYSICYRRLHDVHLAEDATQKVFLYFAAHARTVRPGPLDGFLANIAIKVTIDMWRRRTRRERHERNLMERHALLKKPAPQDRSLSELQLALEGLAATYREPVTLRYMEGMSIDSIAVALDLSGATVRKRLVRALAQLRETMEGQGFDVSLALAAGLLGRIGGSTPSPGLASRISSRVLSARSTPVVLPGVTKFSLLPRLALGLGAASAIGAVVAIQLLPSSTPPSSSSRTPSLAQGLGPPAFPRPMTFNERLKRRVPGMFAQPIPFDFALVALHDSSGVTFKPEWDAIEAAGIGRRTHVTAAVNNSTVIEELDALLKSASPQGALEYVIVEDQAAIIIRPRPGHGPATD